MFTRKQTHVVTILDRKKKIKIQYAGRLTLTGNHGASAFCNFDNTKLKRCYVSFSDKRLVPTHSLVVNVAQEKKSFFSNQKKICYYEILIIQKIVVDTKSNFRFEKMRKYCNIKTYTEAKVGRETALRKTHTLCSMNCDPIFIP